MVGKLELHLISIPGFRYIFVDNQPLHKRFVLSVIILTFFGLSIFQIVERIMYYSSEPTLVTYRFDVENLLRFPSVSICPHNAFNTSFINREKELRNVSNVYDLLNTGLDLNDIWELTGNNFTEHILRCRYSVKHMCMDTVRWKVYNTLMGLCYTLEFADRVSYSGFVYSLLMSFSYDFTHDIRVFLHDIATDISYAVYDRGIHVQPKTMNNLYYNFRQVSYQNLKRRPCVGHETYENCTTQCYIKEILQNRTCRLPFMSPDDTDLRLCSTPEEFRDAYPIPFDEAAAKIFYQVKSCKKACTRPCEKYQYDITIDSRNTNRQDGTRVNVIPLRAGTHMYLEQLSYFIDGLFCDIGAIIGLYLGVSLLTFVELFEMIYYFAIRKKE